ncbi:MAG: hypothetical protein LC796_11815 [Acidobacteria bacterium]|nr:hypothetical protein [Acidobacteriota bacterium]MCA1612345.1 hypothetical protein [Acidobacteriota bacterium]
MPTRKPPTPDTTAELTDRRIAEFALEESRLSNLAYRFELRPRERVWRNWDRTEFEPNNFRIVGLAGVCLNKDERERAHRTALRALEDIDDILFVVEEPAQAVIVRNPTGTSEIVNRPTICAEIVAPDKAGFDRALSALDAAFPGQRVAGKIVSE